MKKLLSLVTVLLLAAPAWATSDRGDGVHTEDWFLNQATFYELGAETQDAAAAGKTLVLVWEQQGCGSCQKLHDVNFQDSRLKAYLQQHFAMMSMNIFGEIIVTDFDGTQRPEKDLAADLKAHRTPTTQFFDEAGKSVFALPGYLDPERYLAAFVFVKEKGYLDDGVNRNFLKWHAANKDRVAALYTSLE